MNLRFSAWLLLAAGLVARAAPVERNAWPFWVDMADEKSGEIVNEQALGPLYSWEKKPGGGTVQAWRPLVLRAKKGPVETTDFLYPLFMWRSEPGYSHFSIVDLVNNNRLAPEAGQPAVHGFDVWPLYFSRETGNPAESYHALFPIAGTIKQRFGKDRLTWYLFPLYFNTDKGGMQITSAPWPFVRVIAGAGNHGFELWPLFGSREKAGDYRNRFWLWPFGYDMETNRSNPQPDEQLGALPFYARESGPGYLSETYVWPFFGYTHRTQPAKYDEHRYFWPFFMQGRGADRYVNRWGPFYTHSVIKGYDKTWLLWPLYRNARWSEDGVSEEKTQFFYFFYWSLEQHSLANPRAAPASMRHVWPLFSVWDNGAGRRQFQLLSPLEVFFPHSDPVRQLYTPLFALYRSDQRAPGDTYRSFLWNLVSWRNSPAGKEFHLGPLGWRRDRDTPQGRFFLFDFHPKRDSKSRESASP